MALERKINQLENRWVRFLAYSQYKSKIAVFFQSETLLFGFFFDLMDFFTAFEDLFSSIPKSRRHVAANFIKIKKLQNFSLFSKVIGI